MNLLLLNSGIELNGVTIDIGGTFLETSEPVPETYKKIGEKYGMI